MIGAMIQGAIARRKVVLAVTLVAALFGFFAYLNLPRESNPDITFPFVSVTVPYPGVSPEDAERLLVRPMEVELQAVEGLKEMNAVASQGAATVTLEFPVNFNKEKALNDIRSKVDMAKGRFPPDAMEPIIEEYNANQDPVLTVVLHGGLPERQLFKTAQDLKDRIETLPGVLRAEVYGGREELLEVTIDPLRMESYKITAGDIANVIRANNQLVPAGNLENGQGKFAVKIPGVVEGPNDILSLPIKVNGDRVVTLGDVAQVHRTFKEAGSMSRVNGEPSMSIDIVKRQGANILDTVKDARKLVDDEKAHWPTAVKVTYTFDQSEDINRSLTLLESGLIIAVILVMIIIVASLGIRAGLLVGAAIPACFMLAFLILQATGITLNMMVMFGLVLAVGMLVDGSIVVVEYADRKLAEGFDKKEAYKLAGERMFWPVFNGIATTLCAFVPFLFWNEIAGKFMSYLPITLFFVLGSSILIALIFTPALGSLFGKRSEEHDHDEENIRISEEGDAREMSGFMGQYARFLWGVVHRPGLTMFATIGVIVAVLVWFKMTPHKTEFFLNQDPEWATVYVKARGNLSTPAMNQIVSQVEARLQNVKGVENVFVRVGRQGGGLFGGAPADTIGSVRMDFVDFDQRKVLGVRGADIEKDVRARVGEIPGVGIEVRKPQGGPQGGKDVQVELRSSDVVALDRASEIILAELNKSGELFEIEDSRTSPGLEWNLAVDREAAGRYGVSVLSVGQAIQFATNGVLAGRFRPDDADDELDIRVRFPADARNLSTFDQLKITTPQGAVPASYFVTRQAAPQVTTINRRDGQRVVVIQANAKPGVAANQVIAKLKPKLEKSGISDAVRWKFRGADEDTAKAGMFFLTAMLVSLFMMGMILLWQFNSFWGVFCTLFAVVLSTVGVVLGIQINLLGTFDYISIIMCGTGVVALAGVIVGHNIVLVDTFYQEKRKGVPGDFAALRAAAMRFRPVLLTTLTAVVGLLPLMFQIEPNFRTGAIEFKPPGSEWWVQMAGAIVWGLSFSTFLTLLVTPTMLALPSVMKARFTRKRTEPALPPLGDYPPQPGRPLPEPAE
ncbi:efflux RND transporter permease subunit [Caulobacter sp. 17J65-9]|uniref:efflux RND transporter permease subunit n=1 Tax=Caulobacter sp. 17J65-9 TaxID=2709382 RepID=UPI0013C577BD|nr:efflux RND transporter permease subunit [Caulobacter sp. 17J65-9]NEX95170.1 efflux RND transporter permease subunit [Caulobacter sp. 17J65-9]